MQNRIYPSKTTTLSRSHSSQKLKFKQIPISDQDFNELNSKYELYKQGTPNTYSEDLISLKAKNIKNDISMMQLPAIDSIINQLSQNDKEKQINQRNYELYPNLLKQSKTRYKEMLSEKQQIKDFIIWFENQYQVIEKSNDTSTKKFQNKQTLIAAGFNEMIGQVAKTSKNRAEILKMLWNRQNQQLGSIIEILNSQTIKKQRTFLEQISKIHQEYQNEIDILRKANKELEENFTKEKKFNRTLIENLRILRKRIKKLEYLVKKLSESNISTKKENLNLIEENIKLLMNIKEISEEEAVILNYRRLQVYQEKEKLKHQKTKKLIELAEVKKQDNLAPLQQLDEKKKALFDYFLERLRQNPDERIFIKEEYFTDEQDNIATIEDYFKNIINRANIKMELLNEDDHHVIPNKDKGVNTDFVEEKSISIPVLHLEKGIQVQIIDSHPLTLKEESDGYFREGDRKLYQIINSKEEDQIEKQSKKRIIQHRISRKNSLTLLQIQSLGQMSSKLYNKKGNMLSSFGKKNKINEQNVSTHKHLAAVESELQSISQSDPQSDTEILAINNNISKDSELTSININPNIINQRKSLTFQNLLQKINEDHLKHDTMHERQTYNLIHLDEDLEQQIKYSQLEDLINKHLMKNEQSKAIQNPEKYLNKILHSLYKNVSLKKHYNFVFELLQVIKTSYGNTKSLIWKFLNIITIIKNYSNNNSLLKIVSMFLKINEKFKIYNEVNREELPEMYFKLFFLLTIKGVNENTFNLWKACTSLEKIKSLDFIAILEEFFSKKKRNYIENKIEELVAVSQYENNKKNQIVLKKQEALDDNAQIVKLNPILLYVLEVYLIEKELYHSSYFEMVQFISTEGYMPFEFFIWVIDFLGFKEDRQNQILKFIFMKKNAYTPISSSQSLQNKGKDKTLKNDFFYKFCVKFDMPLFQELSVTAYARFKLLPEEIQQKYFRMIGVEEWNEIKEDLIQNYKTTLDSELYFKAFMLIVDKLEYQIKKGASIYGEDNYQDKIKRKEQIFSLFYKIIIIEAHKNILEKCKETDQKRRKFVRNI